MKKQWLHIILLLAIVILPPAAFSQKVGTTSMQFLKVLPCARATALGDAYSVWASGAEGVFWNPSGVALAQNQEISTTYTIWIFDARQGALSYALPLGGMGALGLQLQYVDYGSFDEAVATSPVIRQEVYPGLTGRQFHPFSYVIGLTYAKSLTDRFATGLTAKFAHESLFDQSTVTAVNSNDISEEVNTFANALLFDFGLRYNTGYKTVQVGASIQNFGNEIKYATETNSAPLLFRVGVAADVIGTNSLLADVENSRVGIAFDLFQPNDYTQQMNIGVEYEFDHILALRGGYKYNYDSEGFTAGGGLRQVFEGVKFSFDYSYGSLGTYLGSVHRISLGAELQ